MAGCSLINYKSREILYIDHRGLKPQDAINNIHKGNLMVENYKGQELLALIDFRDVTADINILTFLNSDETKKSIKLIKKGAILGVTGLSKVTLNLFNSLVGKDIKAFESEDEAKEYLVNS